MRNCYGCNIEYPKYRSRPSSDGKFRCKRCNRIRRSLKYDTSNKGKLLNTERRKENVVSARKRATQWAKENPDRRKEIESKYRSSEKGLASGIRRTMKHYWADPEFQRKKAVARIHGVTPDFITDLRKRQPVCQLCGTSNDLTVDHMNPVSNGGKAIEGNVQSLCGRCNSWKCDRLFLADGSGYLVGETYGR